jgi:hypothetical protein
MAEFGADAAPRFSLGRTLITRGARAQLSSDDVTLALARHAVGDWGDLDPEDEAANDRALATECRLLYNKTDDGRRNSSAPAVSLPTTPIGYKSPIQEA